MTFRTMTAYEKQDIHRAAYSMIANHGDYATQVAMKRARNLLGDECKAARQTWERIISAIGQIQGRQATAAFSMPRAKIECGGTRS